MGPNGFRSVPWFPFVHFVRNIDDQKTLCDMTNKAGRICMGTSQMQNLSPLQASGVRCQVELFEPFLGAASHVGWTKTDTMPAFTVSCSGSEKESSGKPGG